MYFESQVVEPYLRFQETIKKHRYKYIGILTICQLLSSVQTWQKRREQGKISHSVLVRELYLFIVVQITYLHIILPQDGRVRLNSYDKDLGSGSHL